MRWPTAALGDLCHINIGRTPSRSVPAFWEGGDHPWLSISDMGRSKEISTTKEGITEAAIDACNMRLVNAGTVLFSFKLSIGKVGIAYIPLFTNEAIASLPILDPGILCEGFLVHALEKVSQKLVGDRAAMGMTLNKTSLAEIQIPLPPLKEQRRIAAILDKATELEVLSMQQSRLLEDAEKHLFLEYFGSPFPGKTPWPVAQLGELGSLERGISKHRPRNDPSLMDGPYPFIQTGDVAGCRGKIITFSATYSEKGLAQSRLWPAGTLCITIAANIAKTGILDFDACFPDSVVGFQERNPAIITYVQCWMSFLQRHIEQMAPESAQKNINLEILRGLSIPVPSEDRMEKFHVAILALRCTWSRSTQRRGRTAELKSSLQSVFFAA